MNRNAHRAAASLALVVIASACGRPESAPAPEPPSPSPAVPVEAWRWNAPRQAGVGTPAADAGGIAFTYGHNSVVLLGPDGRERWQTPHLGVRDVAPVLTGEAVLAATDDGLVAFDRPTGRPRWRAAIGERANSPVVIGGRAVVSTWDGSLVALDAVKGDVIWRVPIAGASLGPAAAGGDTVVTTWETERGTEAGVTAVDVSSGELRWTLPLAPGGVSAPAVVTAEGREAPVVVLVDGSLTVRALELVSGRERWQAGVEGAGSPEVPPLPLAGGQVLVAHRLGGMVLFESNGVPVWSESSDGAAVRGGPTARDPHGRFALPLDDGRLLLAGPNGPPETRDPPGLVSGMARGPGGELLVATYQAPAPPNALIARLDW